MPSFKCPECKSINYTKPEDAGVLIVCRQCGNVFTGEPLKEVIK